MDNDLCEKVVEVLARSVEISGDKQTVSELLREIVEHREGNKKILELTHSVRCNQCGGNVRIMPVNTSLGDNIGYGYKSAILCTDSTCLHCEYHPFPPHETVKRFGLCH